MACAIEKGENFPPSLALQWGEQIRRGTRPPTPSWTPQRKKSLSNTFYGKNLWVWGREGNNKNVALSPRALYWNEESERGNCVTKPSDAPSEKEGSESSTSGQRPRSRMYAPTPRSSRDTEFPLTNPFLPLGPSGSFRVHALVKVREGSHSTYAKFPSHTRNNSFFNPFTGKF